MTHAARERKEKEEEEDGDTPWLQSACSQLASAFVRVRHPRVGNDSPTPLKQLAVSLYTTTHTRRSAVKNEPDESEGDEAQAHPLLTLLFELLWSSASYGRSDLPQALRAGN